MIQILLLAIGLGITPLLLLSIFGKDLKPESQKFILLAIAICILTILLVRAYPSTNRYANFAEHFFGGGLPAFFIFEALRRSVSLKMKWLAELTLLFFFVSGLGVMNELVEFGLDQLTQTPYSSDRLDSWYDTLANTLGALLVWSSWKLLKVIRTIKR